MNIAATVRSVSIGAIGFAVTSFVIFGALAWRERPGVGGVRTPVLTGAAYAPAIFETPLAAPKFWRAPGAPLRGGEWRYDLFTPPAIFHDENTRRFTVTPRQATTEKTPEAPFGWELVGVRREPFRLQLIGHVGEGPEAQGVFENLISGEVFLASAGREVPALSLRIEAFGIAPETVAIPESMATEQRVATATVCEDGSSRRVLLTERARQLAGGVVALVATKGDAAPRAVRTGDILRIGTAAYRIGEVSADPPRAEIFKTDSSRQKEAERRVLSPRSAVPTGAPAP